MSEKSSAIGHSPNISPGQADSTLGSTAAFAGRRSEAFDSAAVLPSALSSRSVVEPGSDLGPRYRIEALVGRGGMGIVYKAYDKELDRVLALKLVRPELTGARALQRLKQELLLASKISHKNVLRIHDLGSAGGLHFITMAYVEGEDLNHLLQREGRLPTKRLLNIACQLCSALEAAHSEGVVHRDLKPQNILIDRADKVYVTDFGVAMSLDAGSTAMTRSDEVIGTPRYMSPEQVEGKATDHRADLYSLGLILYEMAAGELPCAGDSAFQVMHERVARASADPRLLNPEVPCPLAWVIMRCLERDPARRYQSATEVRTALGNFQTPQPAAPADELGGILAGVLAPAPCKSMATVPPRESPEAPNPGGVLCRTLYSLVLIRLVGLIIRRLESDLKEDSQSAAVIRAALLCSRVPPPGLPAVDFDSTVAARHEGPFHESIAKVPGF